MAELKVADNEDHLAQIAAERLTQLIERAVGDRGIAFLSLTGGTTPRRLYSYLADAAHAWRNRIPWSSVHLFWGDERHVPPDAPESNYGMAKGTLLDHVPIPPDQVHRMRGELPDARNAAADYERELNDVASRIASRSVVASRSVASAFRRKNYYFDLMLLGLGEDGHIASIFPGSPLLRSEDVGHPFEDVGDPFERVGHPFRGAESEGELGEWPSIGRRVAGVWAPHLNAWRITLTPDAILDSHTIVMLVAGKKKANAVFAALRAPLDIVEAPAQLLRAADDRVEWFVDRTAATGLPPGAAR